MLSINDLKKGTNITVSGEPYVVLFSQHLKMGRGGGQMQTKLKNLITGAVVEKNFKGQETIEPAEIRKTKAQFLYADQQGAYFMDQESFETQSLPKESIGEKLNFLKESALVTLLNYNNQPVNVELPVKIDLLVKSTPPGDRGNTASGSAATKPATLETGAVVNVPMFIKEGDLIRVNTETGEYVERAK